MPEGDEREQKLEKAPRRKNSTEEASCFSVWHQVFAYQTREEFHLTDLRTKAQNSGQLQQVENKKFQKV